MTTVDNMQLAVNAATTALQGLRAQYAANAMGSSDTKRPKAWCEYGFPLTVTGDMLYQIYSRGGIGFGAVSKVVGNCWKTAPEIVEGGSENEAKRESKLEKEVAGLFKKLRAWTVFKKADTYRLARRYSAIIIYYADGKEWKDPVDASKKTIAKLQPVWADALTAGPIDTNRESPRYGQPSVWQYSETDEAGNQLRTVDLHPDRVFIVGDTAADALGFLEPAYNDLVSIEKVSGGGGESFLKNAARQLHANFDKEIDLNNIAAMYGVSLPELKEKFQDVAVAMNRGNDVLWTTQGATVTPLVANVPDPGPVYNVNLQNVASALDIPTKILVGQQQGDRASTEDREYFNSRCQSRRADLGDEIADFVQHLVNTGALPAVAEISVMWDDLNESSKADKLTMAKIASDINAAAFDPTNMPFSADEIRVLAGFEPTNGN